MRHRCRRGRIVTVSFVEMRDHTGRPKPPIVPKPLAKRCPWCGLVIVPSIREEGPA